MGNVINDDLNEHIDGIRSKVKTMKNNKEKNQNVDNSNECKPHH